MFLQSILLKIVWNVKNLNQNKKPMKKQTLLLLGLIIFTSLCMTSCADVEHIKECTVGHTYGFWGGAWHGTITIFSLIGELFSDDIAIYAVNNNGGWYDLGFCLGLGGAIQMIALPIRILFKLLFG